MPEPAARLAGRSGLRRSSSARLPDRLLRWGLTALAAGVLALLGFFLVRLVLDARPAFTSAGVTGFVFRDDWDPGVSAYHGGALLAGTLITSAIALVLGVPIALATAVFTTELCPLRFRPVLTLLVDLMAAVPSIVYGLWGVVFLIPNLRGPSQWFADTFAALPFVGGQVAGPSYLVAGLVLAIMIIPIVSAISGDVLASVPDQEKAAAYALGCTRWEMIRLAALPHARPGIIGAALLGLGRAIGGDDRGAARDRRRHPARRPAVRAGLLAGRGDRERVRRGRDGAAAPGRAARRRPGAVRADPARQRDRALVRRPSGSAPRAAEAAGVSTSLPSRSSLRPRSTRRRVADRAATIVLGLGTALGLVPLVLVVWFLVRRGISTWSVAFFTTDPVGAAGGIRSAIVGTFELVLIATVLAVPVAIAMAVFLIEFGRESAFAGAVRSVMDVMAGVPSIVIGLFVYSALVLSGTGGSFAAWKGAVALALVMLPIITRTAEVELERVPGRPPRRRGRPRSAALARDRPGRAAGRSGRSRAASLLAVARATGETAPLIFTVAAAQALTLDPGAATNSLPLQILHDVQHPAPGAIARAWGAALTLVILVCLANLAARLISRRPPPG